jgi:hypothetical protein
MTSSVNVRRDASARRPKPSPSIRPTSWPCGGRRRAAWPDVPGSSQSGAIPSIRECRSSFTASHAEIMPSIHRTSEHFRRAICGEYGAQLPADFQGAVEPRGGTSSTKRAMNGPRTSRSKFKRADLPRQISVRCTDTPGDVRSRCVRVDRRAGFANQKLCQYERFLGGMNIPDPIAIGCRRVGNAKRRGS